MADVDEAFDSPLGLTWALINRHKQKKMLKAIHNSNIEARGIVHYKPSNIEAFFDENESMGNIVISGVNENIRLRAISRCIECACVKGIMPIIIHSSDHTLENYIVSYFGTNNFLYLNSQFPFYEPLMGLTDNEISHMILNSTTDKYEIKGLGKYYIDGITEFIRSKGIKPYLWMYITCPHMELSDKINEAFEQGKMSESTNRRILSQIVQGELERGNIEKFFDGLRSQGDYIIAKKKSLANATNIIDAYKQTNAIVIDVMSSTNDILINFIMSEIEMLKSKGVKILLCLDNIQVSNNRLIASYIKSSGGQSRICMTSKDVYADFMGEDSMFYSTLGKSSKIVLLKHLSGYSCGKYSEFIGSYDRQEISETYTGNVNYIGKFSYGTTNSKNISIKREEIVKPEDLLRLDDNEVYVIDGISGEIAYTSIV